MHTLKTRDFRPAYKFKSISTTHGTTKINFIPTLKSSEVRSPTLKSSQFGPSRKEVNFHAHSNTSNFQSAHKNVNLTPRTKAGEFRYSQ